MGIRAVSNIPSTDPAQELSLSREAALRERVIGLAGERVSHIQNHLREQGIDLRCGVEMEFYLVGKFGKLYRDDGKALHKLLEGNPFYKEVGQDLSSNRVLGVMGAQVALSALQGAPLALALQSSWAVGTFMYWIGRHYEAIFTNYRDGKFGSLSEMATSIAAARTLLGESAEQLGMKSVTFSPVRAMNTFGLKSAPSMHWNVSAWKDGQAMLVDRKILDTCTAAMVEVQREGVLLKFDSEAEIEAIRSGCFNPGQIDSSSWKGSFRGSLSLYQRGWGSGKRLEDRLSLATCNIQLANAAAVTAMYEGLVRAGVATPLPGNDDSVNLRNEWFSGAKGTETAKLPESMSDAFGRFTDSRLCCRALGGELYDAVIDLYDTILSRNDMLTGPGASATSH